MARVGYLAPASGLIGLPKLHPCHGGEKIGFGSSAFTMLAESMVKIGLAHETDWVAAQKLPSMLVDRVLRRFLADHGQQVITQHFELCLTLGESIIDSAYGEPDPAGTGQLFFVLNTESCASPKFCPAVNSTACTLSSPRVACFPMIDWAGCTTVMIGQPSPKTFPSVHNI